MTAAIRTVIAADELVARRALRDRLAGAGDIELVTECRDSAEAARALAELAPELVFLDMQVPGLDGFAAVLRARPAPGGAPMPRGTPVPVPAPVIVFVTAHERHAARAFELAAIDCLLKPFDDDQFLRALARARAEVQRRRLAAPAPTAGAAVPDKPAERYASRIVVKDGQNVELIDVADIHCIRADAYYAELQLADRSVLLREPMQDLEARLDPDRFVRIHRSAIVNIDQIHRVERAGSSSLMVVLQDGARLPVSRSRRGEIDRVLRAK